MSERAQMIVPTANSAITNAAALLSKETLYSFQWHNLNPSLSCCCHSVLVSSWPAAKIKSWQFNNKMKTAANVFHGNQTNGVRRICWRTEQNFSSWMNEFIRQLILFAKHLFTNREAEMWRRSFFAPGQILMQDERHVLLLGGSVLTPSNLRGVIRDTIGA